MRDVQPKDTVVSEHHIFFGGSSVGMIKLFATVYATTYLI
jgi:hypothetical protein